MELIGRGTSGVVYRAVGNADEPPVAIKMLLQGSLATPEERARFLREARLTAGLRHPGIAPVREIGEENGAPFMVMDYIPGASLEKTLQQRAFEPKETARLLVRLARAVHFAHQSGVIHRDLNLGNILLGEDGEPIITDFGLARNLREAQRISCAGELAGTPAFMAPEQVRGDRDAMDERTDVYALGAILFTLLTRRPPFVRPSFIETINSVLRDAPPRVRALNPTVPARVEDVVRRALKKKPKARHPSALAFAEELESALAQ